MLSESCGENENHEILVSIRFGANQDISSAIRGKKRRMIAWTARTIHVLTLGNKMRILNVVDEFLRKVWEISVNILLSFSGADAVLVQTKPQLQQCFVKFSKGWRGPLAWSMRSRCKPHRETHITSSSYGEKYEKFPQKHNLVELRRKVREISAENIPTVLVCMRFDPKPGHNCSNPG